MNLLLDTHVLLWWLDDNPALGAKAREAISNGENLVLVSVASIWEIRIKQALGKLKIPAEFKEILAEQPLLMLDITVEHAHAVFDLAMHHHDPFDRMLIAQARVEQFTIVTADRHFESYGVPLLLA